MPPKPYTEAQQVAIFWSRVKVGEPNECWEWQGGKSSRGYGAFWWRQRQTRAHHVAFFLSGAFLPEGMCVLHACDNPLCCNPIHLFSGTVRDNGIDKVAKGRQAKGERHGNAKLTEAAVKEIRAEHKAGVTQRDLARRFQVSKHAIYCVLRSRTWSHISDAKPA